ncbi:glycerophosphodiester phosphodiesterase family protein [Gangjinia marincola]|uniref:Glycerophosphodiester phosphodiesterase family protein n=1 Tax=Gangjinia marincola TaxID=578463 RepID=A0ABN1MIN2_9FLAO
MHTQVISCVLVILFLTGCKDHPEVNQNEIEMRTYNFDLQGHRGARGLAPENTLPAFKKALELGVNTLELDVVISMDKKVVVSHEPWFNPEICIDPDGKELEKEKTDRINLYQLTYDQIAQYDCGNRSNPRFPEQKNILAKKPLLTEVIELAEAYAEKHTSTITYNIELKTEPEDDDLFHPAAPEFCKLVIEAIKESIPPQRLTLQSFDLRILNYLHTTYPEYSLAYLVERGSFKANLDALRFTPAIYSPFHELLSQSVVNNIHQKGIKVIPWTVNDPERMQELLSWGVDGIITDYPNRALIFKE